MNCYFFGTFNPIHLGHIKIASEVKREFGFDEIIFVPSYSPPHKETLDFHHRLNMLNLGASEFKVSSIEELIAPPNYSYKTIEVLGRASFIIGYDAFLEINSWKNPEYLKENLEFIVVPRDIEFNENDFLTLKNQGYKFKIMNFLPINISSSMIRKNVEVGLSISNFVPKAVEEYIYEHGLYKKVVE